MNTRIIDELEILDIESARPHQIGRPPKLTRELIEQICDLIIEGWTIERAAKLSGVSATSIYRWLSMGKSEDSESIYQELVQRVKEATECSEFELLQAMRIAGAHPKNWRANAWMLERRFPDKYGKREKEKEPKNESFTRDQDANALTVAS